MDRAEAARILAAYGWRIADIAYAQDGSWTWAHVDHDDGTANLPVNVIRALDPDRPPSLAAVERLQRGFVVMRRTDPTGPLFVEWLMGDCSSADVDNAMLTKAWELGGAEPRSRSWGE